MEPADEPLLHRLFASVRAEELGMDAWDPALRDPILRMQFEAQRRGYETQFPAADWQLILVDDSPRGWMVVDRASDTVHLVDIGLAREARGIGIGTSLMRELQDEAAAGRRPVTLAALRTNLRAIALYSRLGFRATETNDTHVWMEWRPN